MTDLFGRPLPDCFAKLKLVTSQISCQKDQKHHGGVTKDDVRHDYREPVSRVEDSSLAAVLQLASCLAPTAIMSK